MRYVALLSLVFLASCEGMIRAHGHVYDAATRQPLGHVKVVMVLGSRRAIKKIRLSGDEGTVPAHSNAYTYTYAYTDSRGFFQIGSPLIGMVFPPTPLLIFDGYNERKRSDTAAGDSIFVEKRK